MFKDLPVRRKLMTVNLLISGVVLFLTCAAFITYEIITLRAGMVQGYMTRANILAANSTASLAFQNESDADDVLATLKTDPHIVKACIYDEQHHVFAKYPVNVPNDSFPKSPIASGHHFESSSLSVFCPVVQDNRTLGIVYLQSDLSTLTNRYSVYGWLAGAIILSSIFIAYLLSFQLQKQISQPVLALAETANAISKHRDFSIRAVRSGNDELGLLTDAFNQLLASIEERDTALNAANKSLRGEINERKRAEEALARERNLLRMMFDVLPDYIYLKDEQSRFVVCNNRRTIDGMESFFPDDPVGKTDAEFFPPEQAARFRADELKVLGGTPLINQEETLIQADGTKQVILTTKLPFRDSSGKIVGVVGYGRDITERKQAEMKLQAQLARLELLHRITRAISERLDLQSIFQVVIGTVEEHLPVDFCSICLYEQNANVLTVAGIGFRSEPLATKMNLTKDTLVEIDQNGLSQCIKGRLVYEPDISRSQFPFPQKLAGVGLRSLVFAPLLVESRVFGVFIGARRQSNSFSSGECEFLRQLSEHVALAAHQAQLYEALQKAYEDLRQTQQAVMQQERLKALGQMASGIAHDINNAISPVMLYTEWLQENEKSISERSRGHLETIQRAIEDVAHTVARMREFYRQSEQQLALTPVKLNQLIQQVIDLSRARWSDIPQQRGIFIKIETDLAPELPSIMGVESEIREALVNLLFNAVDAMPEGGTLTLRTKISEKNARLAQVEVCDTGIGMDEDTRRRCLEPFFTTKGERGTGLGLAMVYGIVRRHNADIEIDSAPGKGTTLRLIFPVPAQVTGTEKIATVFAVPTRLRILIVDDDPLLIKSLRDTLETDGHLIITANGGQEGINTFHKSKESTQSFDVVITDLGMPYVDGRQVASSIKAMSPATPIILLTGWGQRLVAEGDIPPHVDRVLNKPPKLRELREALAQLFQSPKT